METTNLSKIRREKMLNTISEIKKNITDEKMLTNLSMIENELTKKKYGLIWEEHEERVDKELETQIPTFEEIKDKEIISNPNEKFNFLLEGDNLHSLYLLEKTHKEKFVDLSLLEFYAFVINNEDVLKHDFQEAVSQKARQIKMKLDELKIVDWKAPEMDYIKYDPKMKDTTIYEKSIYMNYPNSTIKSKSERMFEYFCENNENIKWFYKNGESSSDYFSIVYVDAVNHKWHFYPDFIVCDKDNKIWIVETKGGENADGESKNIDIKVENKFEALKQYANKYNVNWGFVRDYDKNDSLYLCNTEYTEDMENENWILLNDVF